MSTQQRAGRPHTDSDPKPPEAVAGLAAFRGRGAGTDAERRAAHWLAGELRGRRTKVSVVSFWCRPNWAMAQAWHVALAVAGSLVSVASARAGGAMLLAALVFLIADASTGRSPGRRLTPERASQNVVVNPPSGKANRIRLIITANYDATRAGLVYRDQLRGLAVWGRRLLRAFTPGWIGWIAVAIIWLLITSLLRVEGHHPTVLGVIQLLPTVGLVVAVALLLELAAADWSPAAGDNATGVSVAMLLARALTVSPPRNLDVELVLTGAGDGDQAGLRHHLAGQRSSRRPTNTVVLGIAACAGGAVHWWRSDSALLPVRYAARLRTLANQVAAEQPQLGARPYQGRGRTPALPARRARIPALALGCLDDRGLVPHSHQTGDESDSVDRRAHDQAVQFGLILVDAIDAGLGQSAAPGPDEPRGGLRLPLWRRRGH
jgi:hypothetical protein